MQYRITGVTVAMLGGAVIAPAASAQTLDVSLTIPRVKAAEYHQPYVAIWLEKDGVAPRTIAVWYDYDGNSKEGAGTKWLRDIRMWWRASGRGLTFPADGITGATRAPGTHKLSFTGGRGSMPKLTPGDYRLIVEAAREGGGRDMLISSFKWDGKTAVSANGARDLPGQVKKPAPPIPELGAVSMTLKR